MIKGDVPFLQHFGLPCIPKLPNFFLFDTFHFCLCQHMLWKVTTKNTQKPVFFSKNYFWPYVLLFVLWCFWGSSKRYFFWGSFGRVGSLYELWNFIWIRKDVLPRYAYHAKVLFLVVRVEWLEPHHSLQFFPGIRVGKCGYIQHSPIHSVKICPHVCLCAWYFCEA